jgi:hypothetical protein
VPILDSIYSKYYSFSHDVPEDVLQGHKHIGGTSQKQTVLMVTRAVSWIKYCIIISINFILLWTNNRGKRCLLLQSRNTIVVRDYQICVGNRRTVCKSATLVIAYRPTQCHKSKYDNPILIEVSKRTIVGSTQIDINTKNVSRLWSHWTVVPLFSSFGSLARGYIMSHRLLFKWIGISLTAIGSVSLFSCYTILSFFMNRVSDTQQVIQSKWYKVSDTK